MVKRVGKRPANAQGQRRQVRIALLDHVEMSVKRRGLEHFDEGELQSSASAAKQRVAARRSVVKENRVSCDRLVVASAS
jgi:hypothetical protein